MKSDKVRLKLLSFTIVLMLLSNLLVACDSGSIDESKIHKVTTYDYNTVVTGDGQLDTFDTLKLDIPKGVLVDQTFVEAGDKVTENEVLAIFNADSLNGKIAGLYSSLDSFDSKLSDKTKKEIKAPASGRVKYISAKAGDNVLDVMNSVGYLMILSTDEYMNTTITTSTEIPVNTKVTVKWDGGNTKGTVIQNTANGCQISLSDEKAPYNESCQVYKGDELLGEGVLSISAPLTVVGTGGTIKKVEKKVNDSVSKGNILFTLNEEVNSDANKQVMAQRNEVSKDLQIALQYVNDQCIRASEDSVVGIFNLSEGNETNEGSIIKLHTGGAIKMVVDIDEEYIANVKVDQPAIVSLYSFPGETFNGTVTRISGLGDSSEKVTTYAVDIILDYDDRLLEGMSGNADIITGTSNNILAVPSNAIKEDDDGKYVLVVTEDGKKERRDVTTGIYFDNLSEITEGLVAGESIYID